MDQERDTERLLKEFFGGKKCCRCPRPAVRLAREQFYCDHHFPYGRGKNPELRKTFRDPKLIR